MGKNDPEKISWGIYDDNLIMDEKMQVMYSNVMHIIAV